MFVRLKFCFKLIPLQKRFFSFIGSGGDSNKTDNPENQSFNPEKVSSNENEKNSIGSQEDKSHKDKKKK